MNTAFITFVQGGSVLYYDTLKASVHFFFKSNKTPYGPNT